MNSAEEGPAGPGGSHLSDQRRENAGTRMDAGSSPAGELSDRPLSSGKTIITLFLSLGVSDLGFGVLVDFIWSCCGAPLEVCCRRLVAFRRLHAAHALRSTAL